MGEGSIALNWRRQQFAIGPHLNHGTETQPSFYPKADPEAEPMGSYASRCFHGFVEVADGKGGLEWRLPESVAIPVLFAMTECVG